MILPPISEDQCTILQELRNGNNVIVDSVAGSGKTTTNLYIAYENPTYNILLLTYSARLRMETKVKQEKLELSNVEVHTYHSFSRKYYDSECSTNIHMIRFLKKKATLSDRDVPIYDIIILDETQDMTSLYFEIICLLLKKNKCAQLCILGDENQSIFEFNGADKRFITMADKIFTQNGFPWVKCPLNVSFRITQEMSHFINHCMMNRERIHSNKISNVKPKYIICNTFTDYTTKSNRVYDEIMKYIDMGYVPEDFFILASSIRGENTPVRILENKIKNSKPEFPIFCPTSDEGKLNEEQLRSKLVFSTYHQVKGLERKIVFVFGMDDFLYNGVWKDIDFTLCPNELYVACTRATEHLVLLHHYKQDYLPFLQKEELSKWCDVDLPKGFRSTKTDKNSHNIDFDIGVCNLLRHLSCEVIDSCFQKLTLLSKKMPRDIITIPTIVYQPLCEDVSDLNGIVLPLYFNYKLKNNNLNEVGCYAKLKKLTNEKDKKEDPLLYREIVKIIPYLKEFETKELSIATMLHISNVWKAYTDKFIHKLEQIKQYTWITQDILDIGYERFCTLDITQNAVFEKSCSHKCVYGKKPINVIGSIDCCDDESIYEFKCVSELTPEHYLQLAIYKYLYESEYKNEAKSKKYYMYNVRSDELVEMQCDYDVLSIMMKDIIESKYSSKKNISDEQFISNMMDIVSST